MKTATTIIGNDTGKNQDLKMILILSRSRCVEAVCSNHFDMQKTSAVRNSSNLFMSFLLKMNRGERGQCRE